MSASDVIAARQDTINRAIDHLRTTDVAALAAQLATTTLHDHLKADPAALADSLAQTDPNGFAPSSDINDWARSFGTWKAAQQVLQAAGLPY